MSCVSVEQLQEIKRLQLEAINLKINHQKIENIIESSKQRKLSVDELETIRNLQTIAADMGEL